jgi:hypothetical protein
MMLLDETVNRRANLAQANVALHHDSGRCEELNASSTAIGPLRKPFGDLGALVG